MCRSQAEAEGLTLLKAENKTGYYGVNLNKPGQTKPYQAQVRRHGGSSGRLKHWDCISAKPGFSRFL